MIDYNLQYVYVRYNMICLQCDQDVIIEIHPLVSRWR